MAMALLKQTPVRAAVAVAIAIKKIPFFLKGGEKYGMLWK